MGDGADVHREPECGHGDDGQDARDRFHRDDQSVRNEAEGAHRHQPEEAANEPRDQRGMMAVARCVRVGCLDLGDDTEQEDDGAEHQDADELDQCTGLDGEKTDRGGSRKHLWDGIDGQAGQRAVLRDAHAEIEVEKRQEEDGGDAQHRGEGKGCGDLLRVCFDHRGDGDDRGVAAYRIAAGNERCELRRQAEQPPDHIGRGDREHHDNGDAGDQPDARAADGREADGRAEKHDGDFQKDFGAEIDARLHGRLQWLEGADGDTERYGKHQAFDPSAAEKADFHMLAGIGGNCDGAGESEAGKDLACLSSKGHVMPPFVFSDLLTAGKSHLRMSTSIEYYPMFRSIN
ncbi:hypothetical protein RHSP_24478 [Rhizobium freirei PRF 81]|uniref:Uncharacterized protein n=1 Tax=Rhizobium freirei PRF 81 TaxID=363754 RepID=N6V872_9HYPH|nr:hypothetical protein RHSP_24478 [Rhizobium freirei PRF 81]